jgi:PPK2 family polyphosphate:nucleotide phosphotransferase
MNIRLADFDTRAPEHFDKEATKELTRINVQKIGVLQDKLYAGQKLSLLIILQGLDASGKDGAVKKVFRSVNPQGIKVKSFKVPTAEEKAHDFLWRVHLQTPAAGMIGIFNRSHYEAVLSPVVQKEINRKTAASYFTHINNFEQLLQDSNTRILKFYLHVSKEKQRERLNERLNDPTKKWKYDPLDAKAARLFHTYTKVYEAIFKNCSTVPWHIIPSDQKWYKQYLLSEFILKELKAMKLKYPSAPTH